MSSAEDFYDYADEHFGWAVSVKTERERAIFLQMAAAWLEVAQKWGELPQSGPPCSYSVSIEATAEADPLATIVKIITASREAQLRSHCWNLH